MDLGTNQEEETRMFKRSKMLTGLCLLSLLALSVAPRSLAAQPAMQWYEVTITNLTAKQVLSPPFLATHPASVHVWQVGQPASDALRVLAEDGKHDRLDMMLQGTATDLAPATAPLMPGKSVTLYIQARLDDVLSAAAMLVQTNDGFTGLDNQPLTGAPVDKETVAYDAGTEDNTEKESDVPGPPFLGINRAPTTPQA